MSAEALWAVRSRSDPGVCVTYSDVRWKNKFWGKSMEIVPVGTTHVVLPGYVL